ALVGRYVGLHHCSGVVSVRFGHQLSCDTPPLSKYPYEHG
ncbi:MAG: hypothetical protein ACI8XM_001615, partial [Haloarculaceae archaeon]